LPEHSKVQGGVCKRCAGTGIDPGPGEPNALRWDGTAWVENIQPSAARPQTGGQEPPEASPFGPKWEPPEQVPWEQEPPGGVEEAFGSSVSPGSAPPEWSGPSVGRPAGAEAAVPDLGEEELFLRARGLGLSPTNIEEMLRGVSNRTRKQQWEWLQRKVVEQRGKPPLSALPSGKPGAPQMSQTAWSQYSESGRRSFELSIPVGEFNPFKPVEPQLAPGHVVLSSSPKHQLPLEKVIGATPWVVEEGKVYTGLEKPSQMPKRIKQMMSRYEQIFVAGKEIVEAPWRAGPEARGPERGQIMNVAYLFGPALPEGQSLISKEHERAWQERTVTEKIPRDFDPALAEVGTTWGKGESLQLFEGHKGIRSGDWTQHELTDIGVIDPLERMSPRERARLEARAAEGKAKLPDPYIQATLRREIDLSRGVGWSSHTAKDLLIRGDIEALLGEPGFDIVKSGGARDVMGLAYDVAGALTPRQYEQIFGEKRPELWSQVARRITQKLTGEELYEKLSPQQEAALYELSGTKSASAIERARYGMESSVLSMEEREVPRNVARRAPALPGGYRYFQMPGRILSAGQVEAFRKAGWLSGEPEALGGGRYRADVMRPGLALPTFTMLTRAGSFEHGRPMVSKHTLGHFQEYASQSRVAESMYTKFIAEGAETQQHLEAMVGAHIATTGHGLKPEQRTKMTTARLTALFTRAEQSVLKAYEGTDPSDIPIGVKQRALIDAIPEEWGALEFEGADRSYFFANPKHIPKVSDVIEDQEHTFSLRSSLATLIQAKAAGDEDEYQEQLQDTHERFSLALSSEKFKQRFSGVTPRSLWAGPAGGSYANMPEEVYLPTRIAARAAGIDLRNDAEYERFKSWFEATGEISNEYSKQFGYTPSSKGPAPRMPVVAWREPTTMGRMTSQQVYTARWIGAHPMETYREANLPIFSAEAAMEMGGDYDKDDYYIAALTGLPMPDAKMLRARVEKGARMHPAGELERQEEKMMEAPGSIQSLKGLQEYLQVRGSSKGVPLREAIEMFGERAGRGMQMGVGFNLLNEMKLASMSPEATEAAERLGGVMYQYGQDYRPWEKYMKSLSQLRNFGSSFYGKAPTAMMSGAANIAMGLAYERTNTGAQVLGVSGAAALFAVPGEEEEVRGIIERGDAEELTNYVTGGGDTDGPEALKRILTWAENSTIGRVAFGRVSAKMALNEGTDITPELTRIGFGMLAVSAMGRRKQEVDLIDYLQAVEDWESVADRPHPSIDLQKLGFWSPRKQAAFQAELSFDQPGSPERPSVRMSIEEKEAAYLRSVEEQYGSIQQLTGSVSKEFWTEGAGQALISSMRPWQQEAVANTLYGRVTHEQLRGLREIVSTPPEKWGEDWESRYGPGNLGGYDPSARRIHLNPEQSYSRMKYTAAHELGHHVHRAISWDQEHELYRSYQKALESQENLPNLGLRKYSIQNFQEFVADTYMVNTLAPERVRESLGEFIGTPLDKLFDIKGKADINRAFTDASEQDALLEEEEVEHLRNIEKSFGNVEEFQFQMATAEDQMARNAILSKVEDPFSRPLQAPMEKVYHGKQLEPERLEPEGGFADYYARIPIDQAEYLQAIDELYGGKEGMERAYYASAGSPEGVLQFHEVLRAKVEQIRQDMPTPQQEAAMAPPEPTAPMSPLVQQAFELIEQSPIKMERTPQTRHMLSQMPQAERPTRQALNLLAKQGAGQEEYAQYAQELYRRTGILVMQAAGLEGEPGELSHAYLPSSLTVSGSKPIWTPPDYESVITEYGEGAKPGGIYEGPEGGTYKRLPEVGLATAKEMGELWKMYYPEWQARAGERLAAGEGLIKPDVPLTENLLKAHSKLTRFMFEARERGVYDEIREASETGAELSDRAATLARLEQQVTQTEEFAGFGKQVMVPMLEQRLGELLGKYPGEEEPALADQWRSRSRVGRQDVLTAYAEGRISREVATGHLLKGTGRMLPTAEEKQALTGLTYARGTYADLSIPVERALAHIKTGGTVPEDPRDLARREAARRVLGRMAGGPTREYVETLGRYAKTGALPPDQLEAYAAATGVYGAKSWVRDIATLQEGDPASARRLLDLSPIGMRDKRGGGELTGAQAAAMTPDQERELRRAKLLETRRDVAFKNIQEWFTGGLPGEELVKRAGAYVAHGTLSASEGQAIAALTGVSGSGTLMQKIGTAAGKMPEVAAQLAERGVVGRQAVEQEGAPTLTPFQEEYMSNFIDSVEKLTPKFQELAETTSSLNEVEQRRYSAIQSWQTQLEEFSKKFPETQLGQRAGQMAGQMGQIVGSPQFQANLAQQAAAEAIGAGGFDVPARQGFLQRMRPTGRGIFSGDLGQLAWGMFNMQRVWRYTGGQIGNLMQDYAGYVGGQQQAMASIGIGEGYTGITADVLRSQASMSRMRLGLGEAAWENWGWVPRMMGGQGGLPEATPLGRLGTGLLGTLGVPMTGALGANVINRLALSGGPGAGLLGKMAGALGGASRVLGPVGLALSGIQVGNIAGGGIARWMANRWPDRFQVVDESRGLPDVLTDVAAGGVSIARDVMTGVLAPALSGFSNLAYQAGNEGPARRRQSLAQRMWEGGPLEQRFSQLVGRLQDMGEPGGAAPSEEQERFESVEERLLSRFDMISPEDAPSLISGYIQMTGRMPGQISGGDIEAIGRLGQLAPAVQQQTLEQGAAVARAAGVQMGSAEMPDWMEWYYGLNPTERAERQRVVSAVNPLVERFKEMGGEMPALDMRTMGQAQATRLGRLARNDPYIVSRAAAAGPMTVTQTGVFGGQERQYQEQGQVPAFMQALEVGQNMQFQTGLGIGSTTMLPLTQMIGAPGTPQLALPMLQQLQGLGPAFFNQQGGQIALSTGEKANITLGGLMGLKQATRLENIAYQQKGFERQFTQLNAQAAYQQDMWGIEDRQTALQRGYQMQQFGFQEQQMDISDWYFKAGQALSREQLLGQADWTKASMGRAHERRQIRFDWQAEDIAFQGAKTGLEFGWQMEDIEESMRYATGRQRRQLMQQRERATVRYGMSMGQLDTQEDRLEQRRQWEEEDHEIALEHHEQNVEWQLRRMELAAEHHELSMELQEERLQASRDYFTEGNRLQDEARDRQRDYWRENHDNQRAAITAAQAHAQAINEYQTAMEGAAEAQALITGEMERVFAADGPIDEGMSEIVLAAADLLALALQIRNVVGGNLIR